MKYSTPKRWQRAYTLVELTIVIAVLGILAAIILPKTVGITEDAQQSATDGAAGRLSGSSYINSSVRSYSTSKGSEIATTDTCTTAATALLEGGLPSGYTTTAVALGGSVGDVHDCVITGPGGKTATAKVQTTN